MRAELREAYEAQQIRQIIPPKVGLGHDAGNQAKHHSDNGKSDKDGVDSDQRLVSLDGLAAQESGSVLRHCAVSAPQSLSSIGSVIPVLNVSLTVHDFRTQTVASSVRRWSLHKHVLSLSKHVDLATAASRQSSCVTREIHRQPTAPPKPQTPLFTPGGVAARPVPRVMRTQRAAGYIPRRSGTQP